MSCLGRPYQFKIWLSSKNFTWFIFEYIEPCNNYILKMKNDLTYYLIISQKCTQKVQSYCVLGHIHNSDNTLS